jgi:hypothetical protein
MNGIVDRLQVAIAELKRLAKPPGAADYVKVHVDTLTLAAGLLTQTEKMATALKPFSDAVYDDNGDMTVSAGEVKYDDFVRAYFALRALPPTKQGEAQAALNPKETQ